MGNCLFISVVILALYTKDKNIPINENTMSQISKTLEPETSGKNSSDISIMVMMTIKIEIVLFDLVSSEMLFALYKSTHSANGIAVAAVKLENEPIIILIIALSK